MFMIAYQKKILSVIIGSLTLSSLAGPAFGHGAMENPKARQWECFSEGKHWGNPNALSKACKAALDNSPAAQAPFDNWSGFTGFAVAPHGVEQAKKGVPDGMLCSGNNPGFVGFNQPRADWTATTIQPDQHGNVGMTYFYTKAHAPSFIEFYINKKNVDPTKKALGWNDVELLKKFDIADGDTSIRHTVNVTIPEDRTGKAIIFTRWQRIDSGNEGFYNCSDVNIKSRDGSEIPEGGGEEDESTENGWIHKGDFITTASNPAVGEKVRFRLMGGTRGDNIVDVYYEITAQNINNHKWVIELGKLLNRDHSNFLQIGQKDEGGNITFNEFLPRHNQVFVSDKNYGYAIEIVSHSDAPTVSLDRYNIEPIATNTTAFGYPVIGSSDKTGTAWKWKHVAGDTRITASPNNQAKTQIRVPGGVNAGASATFELIGTNPKGASGKATLKVNVIAPHVTLTGPTSLAADKEGKFTAKANFDNGNGQVNYTWSLLRGGHAVSGIDQNGSVKGGLAGGDYQVKVMAEHDTGERSATGRAELKVFGNGELPANVPAYNASIAYPTQCTKVSHNGKIWQNQWYVNPNQEEPGTGGLYGVWRVEKANDNSCK
jgi:chitin-binding protein